MKEFFKTAGIVAAGIATGLGLVGAFAYSTGIFRGVKPAASAAPVSDSIGETPAPSKVPPQATKTNPRKPRQRKVKAETAKPNTETPIVTEITVARRKRGRSQPVIV